MRKILTLSAAALLALSLSACDMQMGNDAPQTPAEQHAPAEVGAMPDGFSNWATSCNHGNRVYTIYHRAYEGSGYGAIAVVANDPSCAATAK